MHLSKQKVTQILDLGRQGLDALHLPIVLSYGGSRGEFWGGENHPNSRPLNSSRSLHFHFHHHRPFDGVLGGRGGGRGDVLDDLDALYR